MTDAATRIEWTEFPNLAGKTMESRYGSWPDLLERIRRAGPYATKDAAPLLKLATFGEQRSRKGSLRHDANVLAVNGVEVDYDAGGIDRREALRLLEAHHIRAATYPTASSTRDQPRWRLFFPLAEAALPADRVRLVAWANGALGGVISPESFTLSQCYYFGEVAGAKETYEVMPTFGDPTVGEFIDKLVELDRYAIGKVERRLAPAPTEEGQRSSESILQSSSVGRLSSSVGFPPGTLPMNEGQRNGCLFLYARHIKRTQPFATRDELRVIVKRWHELALPAIATKEFAVTFHEFMHAFERVKVAFGAVWEDALRRSRDLPLPAGVLPLGYGEAGNQLVRFCSALQMHWGSEPFFLSARKAGELLDVHFTDANKMLNTLVGDGVLELVLRGSGIKASRYRFAWCGPT